MYRGFWGAILKIQLYLESLYTRVFSARYNPFYFLGAICIFFLWILLVTGIYLFIFYKMSPEKAYESVQYLTVDQWYLGGVMRSLHRYASDGLVIAMVLHTLQVFVKDKYKRFRWLAWVSGVGLIIFTLFEGVSGYWLVWDHLAQTIALYTAEFIDLLPIFGEPLTRAFINNESVTGLFFFLMLGMHSAVPIFGLILILLHIAGLSRAKINPPWLLNGALFGTLLVLSFVKPAVSGPPADLLKLPTTIGVDWFYLFYLPLFEVIPPWQSWIISIVLFGFLTVLPWLTREKRPPIAEVSLRECTGCSQCFEDCPYEAIIMQPRTAFEICPYCGEKREKEAVIIPKRCASCGICVGSCDYRSMHMGEWSYEGMKKRIKEIMVEDLWREGEPKVIGFVCNKSVDLEGVVDWERGTLRSFPNVRIVPLVCSGLINPNITAFALRAGADGVFVTGCQPNDCHFRMGNTWLEERFSGNRRPTLKVGVDGKVRVFWSSGVERKAFLKEVGDFVEDLRAGRDKGILREKVLNWAYAVPAALLLMLPAALIFYFSDASYSFYTPDTAQLKLSFKHTTPRVVECDETGRLQKEVERYRKLLQETKRVPMHQISIECGRERFPALVELYVDGKRLLEKTYKPRGLRRDGAVYVYERFNLKAGMHRVTVKMRASGRKEGYDYIFDREIEIPPSRVVVVDFDELKDSFVIMGEGGS